MKGVVFEVSTDSCQTQSKLFIDIFTSTLPVCLSLISRESQHVYDLHDLFGIHGNWRKKRETGKSSNCPSVQVNRQVDLGVPTSVSLGLLTEGDHSHNCPFFPLIKLKI